MSNAVRVPVHTYEEYLALVEETGVKHEFIEGVILAMAGGTPEHARLAMAVGASLVAHAGPCRTYSSDLRIRVPETGRATYADVTVVCGPLETHPEDPDACVNPTILVEVLSPTTERDDRGEKFSQYRKLASLQDYVLVSQSPRRIEHFRRSDGGAWVFTEAGPGQHITLSTGATLAVDTVYGPEPEPPPG